eukprot:scaffold99276_cov63-Phaeocystis_antarctica.AAC.1
MSTKGKHAGVGAAAAWPIGQSRQLRARHDPGCQTQQGLSSRASRRGSTASENLALQVLGSCLSAGEYESGFRAGEREQHTQRRAGEFFGGGRYALLARARALLYRGVFYTPSVNVALYTFATTRARAFLYRGVLYTPSVNVTYTFATTRARAFLYRGVFYTPSVNVTRSQQRSQQLRNLRVKSSRES